MTQLTRVTFYVDGVLEDIDSRTGITIYVKDGRFVVNNGFGNFDYPLKEITDIEFGESEIEEDE